MHAFFTTIESFLKLSEESRDALAAILQKESLPKGYILVKPDSVCRRIYFIEKGLTRTAYNKEGKEVTDWLSAENSFAGSMISFLTQKPDRRTVELLEPSVLWSFPYSGIELLYRKNHQIEQLGRLLTNHAFVLVQQRFDDLHFATAQERYKKFVETSPALISRVPLGIIASYLGMTPETLSRIRSGC